jgi:hypothetical protein
MSGSIIHRWYRGPELRDWRTLNGRLSELELILNRIHERAENGPLPGSYISVPLIVGNVQLGNSTHTYAAVQVIEAEMRPIFFSLFIGDSDPKGTSTSLQVYSDSNPVLSAAVSVGLTTNFTHVVSNRSDFALDTLAGGSLVRLQAVVPTTAGAFIKNIHARLVCKHVGKVEPA